MLYWAEAERKVESKQGRTGLEKNAFRLCFFPCSVYTHTIFLFFPKEDKTQPATRETTAMAASKHPPSEKPFKTLTVPTEPEPFPSFVQPPFFLSLAALDLCFYDFFLPPLHFTLLLSLARCWKFHFHRERQKTEKRKISFVLF